MPARTPRRSFASPFVVTLAAAPACFTSNPPPQPVEPAPQQQPAPVVVNPPRPEPAPESPAMDPPPASRPPIAMNPPRPQPPRPDPSTVWTVFKTKQGCAAAIKVDCPHAEPGRPQPTCNPPPPRPYACPEGVSLDQPITVIPFGEGCAIEPPPMHCPPHAMCNPPPPHPVACPK